MPPAPEPRVFKHLQWEKPVPNDPVFPQQGGAELVWAALEEQREVWEVRTGAKDGSVASRVAGGSKTARLPSGKTGTENERPRQEAEFRPQPSLVKPKCEERPGYLLWPQQDVSLITPSPVLLPRVSSWCCVYLSINAQAARQGSLWSYGDGDMELRST